MWDLFNNFSMVKNLKMIQTENTPNPNALKFTSNQRFSDIGVKEFQKKDIKEIQNIFIKNLLNF